MPTPNRASLTATFNQEATRVFAEHIVHHFAHDLGGGWDEWPQVMRRHFIKRFLLGMLEGAFHHPANPQDVGYLANLSWSELITPADRLDQGMSPRTGTPTEAAREDYDPPQPTVFALQQYSPDLMEEQWTATGQQAHYPPSPPYHDLLT